MSYYWADIGRIRIRPEHRLDFGCLFHGDYEWIGPGPVREFADEWGIRIGLPRPIRDWEMGSDYGDPDWGDGYATSYDPESGLFVFRVDYNAHGYSSCSMDFKDMMKIIAEDVLWHEGRNEDWWGSDRPEPCALHDLYAIMRRRHASGADGPADLDAILAAAGVPDLLDRMTDMDLSVAELASTCGWYREALSRAEARRAGKA